MTLAADLSRYGSSAQWKGVYSRGEKIGFMVGQTIPRGRRLRAAGGRPAPDDAARRHHAPRACTPSAQRGPRVPAAVVPRSRSTRAPGPSRSAGTLDGRRLQLTVQTPVGHAHARRASWPSRPALTLNLSRRLAAGGPARPASTSRCSVFDPATLRNAPMTIDVEAREVVRAAGRPVPAFKVRTQLRRHHLHVVDHRHRRGRARGEPARLHRGQGDAASARCPWPCPARCRATCCEAAAVVPEPAARASTIPPPWSACACG